MTASVNIEGVLFISEKLSSLCMVSTEMSANGPLGEARKNFDRLRRARALFSRFFTLPGHGVESLLYSREQAALLGAIFKEIASSCDRAYFAYVERINRELACGGMGEAEASIDLRLPPSWDWRSDILVLGEVNKSLQLGLTARGQRRLFILGDDQSLIYLDAETGETSRIDATQEGEITEIFSKWSASPPQLITNFVLDGRDSEKGPPREGGMLTVLQEAASIISASRNTALMFARKWILQNISNLAVAPSCSSVQIILEVLRGQDVVVVSPGPSLQKNIDVLKSCKEKVIIIAVAQACPALRIHGIAPDFVMVSDPDDYASVLDSFEVEASCGLIIIANCNQKFLNLGFSNVFLIFAQNCYASPDKILAREGIYLRGGSVSINACDLAIKAGSRTVSLVGQDLSFGGDVYYGLDRVTSKVEGGMDRGIVKIAGKEYKLIEVPAAMGGVVHTKGDYWMYIKQFESLAKDCGDTLLFNATEGGALIAGFKNITLDEYMRHFATEKRTVKVSKRTAQDSLRIKSEIKIYLEGLVSEINEIVGLCIDALRTCGLCRRGAEVYDDLGVLEGRLRHKIHVSPFLSMVIQRELFLIEVCSQFVECLDENLMISELLYNAILDAANAVNAEAKSVLSTF